MKNPDEVPVSLTEGTGTIVSRPGAGKAARVLIPTLLTDPYSHVVADAATDVCRATHEQRDRLACDGSVLRPFSDEFPSSDSIHKGET